MLESLALLQPGKYTPPEVLQGPHITASMTTTTVAGGARHAIGYHAAIRAQRP